MITELVYTIILALSSGLNAAFYASAAHQVKRIKAFNPRLTMRRIARIT